MNICSTRIISYMFVNLAHIISVCFILQQYSFIYVSEDMIMCANLLITGLEEYCFEHSKYSDSDECAVNNGQCEQVCTNNVGSFRCSCRNGFILDSNGFNCSGVK